jgi:hypothetical protein
MMAMTIHALNARTANSVAATPARAAMPPENTPPPQKAVKSTESSQQGHGVRTAEKQPGEVKDPTWKLQELLDGKK